jgi:hypothetical protein
MLIMLTVYTDTVCVCMQAPLETLVILYFGIRIVGVAFLSAMAALALLIPLQVKTHTMATYLQ